MFEYACFRTYDKFLWRKKNPFLFLFLLFFFYYFFFYYFFIFFLIQKCTLSGAIMICGSFVWIIRIHHECPCKIGKTHPRGRNFNHGQVVAESSVGIPTLRVRFPYPAWTGSWRILFSPPLRLIPRTSGVMWDRSFSRGQIWAKVGENALPVISSLVVSG